MNQSLTSQIAKHIRDVHFGGNWTTTNLKELLSDVTWEEANRKIDSFNTILSLTFHINYFIAGVAKLLEGEELTIRDKYSFMHPSINSEEEWKSFQDKVFTEAENFALLIEKLPDTILNEDFYDPKYGNYFRNFHGIIEHSHYHLGQIVIIKKLIRSGIIN